MGDRATHLCCREFRLFLMLRKRPIYWRWPPSDVGWFGMINQKRRPHETCPSLRGPQFIFIALHLPGYTSFSATAADLQSMHTIRSFMSTQEDNVSSWKCEKGTTICCQQFVPFNWPQYLWLLEFDSRTSIKTSQIIPITFRDFSGWRCSFIHSTAPTSP